MKSADVLNDKIIKRIVIILLIISGFIMVGQNIQPKEEPYGVYIGANHEDLKDKDLAKTIVIDAQYYSNEEISDLKKEGHIVYTYLNLGSIESFRDYYDDYKSLTLGTYENWEDEKWVDVTDIAWQQFLSDKADELIDKGVDGFFIDNTDVYYHYATDEVFESVSGILKNLQNKDTYIFINGGDAYVTEYLNRYGSLSDVLDGVNQENVYTTIDWDSDSFTVNAENEREYFLEYLQRVKADGKDAYALDYATDPEIIKASKAFAKEHGYTVYVSKSIELD
ncbi:extracellular protein [Pseudobutyrivibrio sp. ACV-2]|uniref:endo alpha-1,4 polygalactosaminidase n=1 Tax=Pseudobutyrivibrio sp. ACV-2 TaxID=1520801 RepID=UPI00089B4BC0|nr:endo alpha-1,4 polygalactosaminidase [Pseudobutyrivibrio sp. ACV-2]SEA46475.1 extracellular protein [Pseudobutyrivibrio sp. ACV-2]